MRAALICCVAIALTSCTEDLPKPELIADLRILSVRAEPPEGTAGTTVALDALIATPDPGASVARAWLACIAVGGSQIGPEACALAALPTVACADAPEATACLLGSGETASYRLPSAALAGRAAGESGQVFILLVAADGTADCAGALLAATVPAGCRVAAKRVAVTAAASATPNTNPTVSDLTIAGSAVSVVVPASAADATADGPEALFLSWFITAGAIDSFRTDATGAGLMNAWTPADAAGRIYVVVRDGRGGEAWVTGSR